MEENLASQRVLEKCGFRRVHQDYVRPVRSSEEGYDEVAEEDHHHLSQNEIDELKNAIEEMNIQTKPEIEPTRADIGVETIPMKRVKLIEYRYEPTSVNDQLLETESNQ